MTGCRWCARRWRAARSARPRCRRPSSAASSARPSGCGWKRLRRSRWRAGQVRVAVRAAGINFPDILMAAGEYQLKPELPFTPGMESAGDVVEVNGAARRRGRRPRDRQAAPWRLCRRGRGRAVAADAAAVDLRLRGRRNLSCRARHRLSRPDRSRKAAAGRGAAGAWRGRRRRPRGGGDRQAARRDRDRGGLIGGEAATSRKARGADHLVLYAREPFRDAVKRITDGRGADVVYDPVGGQIFEDSVRCIAWGARLLVIGFTGGIGLGAHQPAADQGRERARRARRRGGAQESRARRGQAEAAARMGGRGQDPAQRLASAAAGGLCRRRCSC